MASDHETIVTMEATPVKFGTGASADAGWELKRLGIKRAMLVTDPGVAALGHPERIKKLIVLPRGKEMKEIGIILLTQPEDEAAAIAVTVKSSKSNSSE